MATVSAGSCATARDLFELVTGKTPYGYQQRLAEREDWPDLLDVPTGLGKTAAVVLSWLWKRLQNDPQTGRRLVYCLPMRSLVEQTFDAATAWCDGAAPCFRSKGLEPPRVFRLMGGDADETEWDLFPGHPQIIIGTQDMLLSRALGRGYGMSRYAWPLHFGLLNSDCLWVFDETQLMGVGVETSAQLQALREALGAFGPARTLWMSATLAAAQLSTVDHREPSAGWVRHALTDEERANEEHVRDRLLARKQLQRADDLGLAAEPDDSYFRRFAERVAAAATSRGGLTLVIVNRVDRAQRLYEALRKALPDSPHVRLGLLHSRFRLPDRRRYEELLTASDDRIIVSTQVVEAGVDVSARTLFTELAPWPSLVQRFGRCNRYGEAKQTGVAAEIHWIPILPSEEGKLALPYTDTDLSQAAMFLAHLAERGGDAGPESLRAIQYEPPPDVRHVVRRRDLVELFDTSPDLLGYDIDVSRFVREADDLDLHFFWRPFELEGGRRPPARLAQPGREELCRVRIGSAREFLKALARERARAEKGGKETAHRARLLQVWRWNPLEERWEAVRGDVDVRPGEILLLHAIAGGYDLELGWTGETGRDSAVPSLEPGEPGPLDSMPTDAGTNVGAWILLRDHLAHVEQEAQLLAGEVSISTTDLFGSAVVTAARWHDVGKAHEQFQRRLLDPLQGLPDRQHPGPGPWAKSDHQLRAKGVRRYFRHELASAMVWLTHCQGYDPRWRDLVAFLVAAHHGKVRLVLRSIPGENRPAAPDALFARGVWDGDVLPPIELPGGEQLDETRIDLSPMLMGEGSWTERIVALRDDPEVGPFRLAYLEALLRAADKRASEKERTATNKGPIYA